MISKLVLAVFSGWFWRFPLNFCGRLNFVLVVFSGLFLWFSQVGFGCFLRSVCFVWVVFPSWFWWSSLVALNVFPRLVLAVFSSWFCWYPLFLGGCLRLETVLVVPPKLVLVASSG